MAEIEEGEIVEEERAINVSISSGKPEGDTEQQRNIQQDYKFNSLSNQSGKYESKGNYSNNMHGKSCGVDTSFEDKKDNYKGHSNPRPSYKGGSYFTYVDIASTNEPKSRDENPSPSSGSQYSYLSSSSLKNFTGQPDTLQDGRKDIFHKYIPKYGEKMELPFYRYLNDNIKDGSFESSKCSNWRRKHYSQFPGYSSSSRRRYVDTRNLNAKDYSLNKQWKRRRSSPDFPSKRKSKSKENDKTVVESKSAAKLDESLNLNLDETLETKIVPGSLGEMLVKRAIEKLSKFDKKSLVSLSDSSQFSHDCSTLTGDPLNDQNSVPVKKDNDEEDELTLRYQALQSAVKSCESDYIVKSNILQILRESKEITSDDMENIKHQLSKNLEDKENSNTINLLGKSPDKQGKEVSSDMEISDVVSNVNEPGLIIKPSYENELLISTTEVVEKFDKQPEFITSSANNDASCSTSSTLTDAKVYLHSDNLGHLDIDMPTDFTSKAANLRVSVPSCSFENSASRICNSEVIDFVSSIDNASSCKSDRISIHSIEKGTIDLKADPQIHSNENSTSNVNSGAKFNHVIPQKITKTWRNKNESKLSSLKKISNSNKLPLKLQSNPEDEDEDILRARLLKQIALSFNSNEKKSCNSYEGKKTNFPKSNESGANISETKQAQNKFRRQKFFKDRKVKATNKIQINNDIARSTSKSYLDIGGLSFDNRKKVIDASSLKGFSMSNFPPVKPVIICLEDDSEDESDMEDNTSSKFLSIKRENNFTLTVNPLKSARSLASTSTSTSDSGQAETMTQVTSDFESTQDEQKKMVSKNENLPSTLDNSPVYSKLSEGSKLCDNEIKNDVTESASVEEFTKEVDKPMEQGMTELSVKTEQISSNTNKGEINENIELNTSFTEPESSCNGDSSSSDFSSSDEFDSEDEKICPSHDELLLRNRLLQKRQILLDKKDKFLCQGSSITGREEDNLVSASSSQIDEKDAPFPTTNLENSSSLSLSPNTEANACPISALNGVVSDSKNQIDEDVTPLSTSSIQTNSFLTLSQNTETNDSSASTLTYVESSIKNELKICNSTSCKTLSDIETKISSDITESMQKIRNSNSHFEGSVERNSKKLSFSKNSSVKVRKRVLEVSKNQLTKDIEDELKKRSSSRKKHFSEIITLLENSKTEDIECQGLFSRISKLFSDIDELQKQKKAKSDKIALNIERASSLLEKLAADASTLSNIEKLVKQVASKDSCSYLTSFVAKGRSDEKLRKYLLRQTLSLKQVLKVHLKQNYVVVAKSNGCGRRRRSKSSASNQSRKFKLDNRVLRTQTSKPQPAHSANSVSQKCDVEKSPLPKKVQDSVSAISVAEESDRSSIVNDFGILCPFDLLGRCNDFNCVYQHTSCRRQVSSTTVSFNAKDDMENEHQRKLSLGVVQHKVLITTASSGHSVPIVSTKIAKNESPTTTDTKKGSHMHKKESLNVSHDEKQLESPSKSINNDISLNEMDKPYNITSANGKTDLALKKDLDAGKCLSSPARSKPSEFNSARLSSLQGPPVFAGRPAPPHHIGPMPLRSRGFAFAAFQGPRSRGRFPPPLWPFHPNGFGPPRGRSRFLEPRYGI